MTTARHDSRPSLPKAPTGITGLDEITGGGLPRGRPTLVCGAAGCGKTLMAMEFLVHGAVRYDEPGVFMAFEERPEELATNVRSLGFDLEALVAHNRVAIDYVHIDPAEIDETGAYDLEGLFIRLGYAIDSIGARRVALDTIENLFAGLADHFTLRAELRRLFRFLKDRGVTAVVTCERGDGRFSRHGLEEYVSDCVILLDHRIEEQLSTRRLRIVKYRGSSHGTDEYPFLIDEDGISVFPVTSLGLQHSASTERVSSGVPQLDAMLGEGGFFRGSTVLVSGGAGTGKTSIAAHFAAATCARNERCLYVAFEESRSQIERNMRSIGIDLAGWVESGQLRFQVGRPSLSGLETHLAVLHRAIEQFDPAAVVIDPLTSLLGAGSAAAAEAMTLRLIDFLKARGTTALLNSLTSDSTSADQTEIGVSSLIDTWLLLRNHESNGERNRLLYILKSRGMAHSNQVREFLLTDHGVRLLDVYVGADGVLIGSSRAEQEARNETEATRRQREVAAREQQLDRRRKAIEAQIAALVAERDAETHELEALLDQQRQAVEGLAARRFALEAQRQSGDGATDDRR